jgi:hypothetical protein
MEMEDEEWLVARCGGCLCPGEPVARPKYQPTRVQITANQKSDPQNAIAMHPDSVSADALISQPPLLGFIDLLRFKVG